MERQSVLRGLGATLARRQRRQPRFLLSTKMYRLKKLRLLSQPNRANNDVLIIELAKPRFSGVCGPRFEMVERAFCARGAIKKWPTCFVEMNKPAFRPGSHRFAAKLAALTSQ